MSLRESENLVHLAAHPGIVHGHDRPCAWGDEILELRFINVERVRPDIRKDNFRTPERKGIGRRDKRKRGHNDFIARLKIQEKSRPSPMHGCMTW